MAYNAGSAPYAVERTGGFWRALKSFARLFGLAMVAAASTNKRMQRVDRLNALSDAELAAKGLRREDIMAYVYRDMLDI